MKTYISTKNAPAAIGPYSQGILAGDTLYISGQIPVNPSNGEIPSDIASQTTQCLENIKAILAEADFSLNDVVKCSVLLDDISNFDTMNSIYAEYFCNNKPARVCFEVSKLPKGVKIEIDAIAVR
ncbi:MAG: RidA family protein [Rikenellaceae bacterium]